MFSHANPLPPNTKPSTTNLNRNLTVPLNSQTVACDELTNIQNRVGAVSELGLKPYRHNIHVGLSFIVKPNTPKVWLRIITLKDIEYRLKNSSVKLDRWLTYTGPTVVLNDVNNDK